MSFDLYLCPVCGERLKVDGRSCLCKNRHCFDIARDGYINLATRHTASGDHGDNREMIRARRDFLSIGHYAHLMDTLADLALIHTPVMGVVLDAGAGECSYTERIAHALASAGRSARVLGVDLSKDALSLGGRRKCDIALAVASVYHLPLSDNSVDMLFEIFAPFVEEEYARVLKSGGKMVMAIPAARHLFELKSILYDTPYENEVQDTSLSRFRLVERRRVEKDITLEKDEDVWNLFTMTPYFYRTSPAAKEKLRHASPLTVTAAFEVLVYEKI